MVTRAAATRFAVKSSSSRGGSKTPGRANEAVATHASDEMVENRRNFIMKDNLQFLELIRRNERNLDRGEGLGKKSNRKEQII